MDGASQNSDVSERRLAVVQAWMLSNVQNRSYERHDELHVDRIDPDWKPREKWIDAGVEAFRLAVDLRDKNQLRFTVVLAYSLVPLKPPHSGMGSRTREELESQLGWSPPSLYLFPPGNEPGTPASAQKARGIADNVVVRDLPSDLLGIAIGKRWYYLEFRQVEFDGWSRSVFVEG
jgi:hypothetical protein